MFHRGKANKSPDNNIIWNNITEGKRTDVENLTKYYTLSYRGEHRFKSN